MKSPNNYHKYGRFDRIILMRVVHDNFVTLPANARELEFIVLRNNRSG